MQIIEIQKNAEEKNKNSLFCESHEEHNVDDYFEVGPYTYKVINVGYNTTMQTFLYKLVKTGRDRHNFNYSIKSILDMSIIKITDVNRINQIKQKEGYC